MAKVLDNRDALLTWTRSEFLRIALLAAVFVATVLVSGAITFVLLRRDLSDLGKQSLWTCLIVFVSPLLWSNLLPKAIDEHYERVITIGLVAGCFCGFDRMRSRRERRGQNATPEMLPPV